MPKFMCVFPHPDDESFAVGGTVALLSQTHEVQLICCTDGNHQDLNLKQIRKRELQNSARILGISQVHQLDFADGYLCNANYHALAAQIRSVLDDQRPQIIITYHPNGYSGHIDHIVTTSVVNYLFAKLSYLEEIWYYTRPQHSAAPPDYFVYWPEGVPPEQINKQFDASRVWDQVVRSIRAHKSQRADGEQIISAYSHQAKIEHFIVRSKA